MILKEHGTNCEYESRHAFERAGAQADIVHMEDLIADRGKLGQYQVLMFPGGFSHGDDTGAGVAWANRVRNHLEEEVARFVEADHLVLGVCNGFQVMTNLGILPRIGGKMAPMVALTHNETARYVDRWVDLEFPGKGPWLRGLGRISLPIAHGEGRFFAEPAMLDALEKNGMVAARYVAGEICGYQGLPANPNGALRDIAGITDESGRVLGLMPHPERAIEFTQLPDWTLRREICARAGRETPEEGPGMALFRNAVAYFR
jgi:phosphoribosylformylglycinamidine synthase